MWTGGPFDYLRHASHERDVPTLLFFRLSIVLFLVSDFNLFLKRTHQAQAQGKDPLGLLHTRLTGAGLGLDAMLNR
jgi:hypothetical protein